MGAILRADSWFPDALMTVTSAALGSRPCLQPHAGILDRWTFAGKLGYIKVIYVKHRCEWTTAVPAQAHLSVLLLPKPRCCVISLLYDWTVLLLYLGLRVVRLELKKEWWSTQDLQRFLQVFGQGRARDTSQSWVSPCSMQNLIFNKAWKF